jgi:hypothetical protein
MLRYCTTAAALGAGWFVVLLVPGMTRQWLLADIGRNLGCLAVASVVIAVVCRGFIGGADSFGGRLLRAVVVPFLGCFVFLTLWTALLWVPSLVLGGLANLHDTLSLYVMGLAATAISFYVVVPYGLVCQYVMESVLDGHEA